MSITKRMEQGGVGKGRDKEERGKKIEANKRGEKKREEKKSEGKRQRRHNCDWSNYLREL